MYMERPEGRVSRNDTVYSEVCNVYVCVCVCPRDACHAMTIVSGEVYNMSVCL